MNQIKFWTTQYIVPLNPVECHHLIQTSDLVGLILVQSLYFLAYYALHSVVYEKCQACMHHILGMGLHFSVFYFCNTFVCSLFLSLAVNPFCPCFPMVDWMFYFVTTIDPTSEGEAEYEGEYFAGEEPG